MQTKEIIKIRINWNFDLQGAGRKKSDAKPYSETRKGVR